MLSYWYTQLPVASHKKDALLYKNDNRWTHRKCPTVKIDQFLSMTASTKLGTFYQAHFQLTYLNQRLEGLLSFPQLYQYSVYTCTFYGSNNTRWLCQSCTDGRMALEYFEQRVQEFFHTFPCLTYFQALEYFDSSGLAEPPGTPGTSPRCFLSIYFVNYAKLSKMSPVIFQRMK